MHSYVRTFVTPHSMQIKETKVVPPPPPPLSRTVHWSGAAAVSMNSPAPQPAGRTHGSAAPSDKP